ncbi:MAG: acetyl-CoA carboxylase biotin carboxylase subunit [Oligosphaeraceae bacterium]|nr:acetyl-CoA carboxylase biotin carboxylase subunit [Oligosphaeraceae bacterium]
MIPKILIANRGEIAVRVIRACRELGLPSVQVFSEADRESLPVKMADEAICIGRGPASESYLKIERIIAAAELSRASAIHPGYGFLSENAHFAEVCAECNLIFIGPSARSIRTLGNKSAARTAMLEAGVPIVPGSDGPVSSSADARKWAERLGYPVMLKAASGGGGKGMRIVWTPEELEKSFQLASQEATRAFSDGTLYMERYLSRPRHVEFQLMADHHGNIVHLGDRDCSLQRRHQKLLEETPSPGLSPELRQKMGETAIQAAKAVSYIGAGTVEFLLNSNGEFFFMEMNTRLQVEHGVTEVLTDTDLVREQLLTALGNRLSWRQKNIRAQGHVLEIRINAEDPSRNFLPCPGRIQNYLPPGGPGIRVDSHLYNGYMIPPYYDSMLAKIIVQGTDREQAIARARGALRELVIEGVTTNRDFALQLLSMPDFVSGNYHSSTVEEKIKAGEL